MLSIGRKKPAIYQVPPAHHVRQLYLRGLQGLPVDQIGGACGLRQEVQRFYRRRSERIIAVRRHCLRRVGLQVAHLQVVPRRRKRRRLGRGLGHQLVGIQQAVGVEVRVAVAVAEQQCAGAVQLPAAGALRHGQVQPGPAAVLAVHQQVAAPVRIDVHHLGVHAQVVPGGGAAVIVVVLQAHPAGREVGHCQC